jgi:hypothetical protein
MKKPRCGVLLCSLAALSAPALAESLAEQERWATQTDYSDRYVADIKELCGATVPLTYEKSSWNKAADKWGEGSPNGRCQDVYNALDQICRGSDAGKKAVAAKVKAVTCGYGGKNSGYKLSMNGGAISYSVEVDKPNVVELIAGELKKKL